MSFENPKYSSLCWYEACRATSEVWRLTRVGCAHGGSVPSRVVLALWALVFGEVRMMLSRERPTCVVTCVDMKTKSKMATIESTGAAHSAGPVLGLSRP